MPRRLFIAIDPPENVQHALARMIRRPPQGVRPVPVGRIHLTLHFLGEVGDEEMTRLTAALQTVCPEAFSLDLAGVGCFPSLRRPAVLWAGVRPIAALADLHAAIRQIITACDLPTESRPFTPHITLARLAPGVPRQWTNDFLREHAALAVDGIPVHSFALYESRRTDEGHAHMQRATFPLRGDSRPKDGA